MVVNGDVIPGARVSDRCVQLPDRGVELSLTGSDVLREGDLSSTILRNAPILEAVVPRRVRTMHERKWRSRGVVHGGDADGTPGWVIHEVVHWPATKP